MAVKLRCSSCRGSFRWNTEEKWPSHCPMCGVEMGNDRADDDVVMPFVRSSSVSKSHDQLYRDMESASSQRAEAAASQLNVPVSEVSDLKITNLRSTKNPGDVAAPPLPAHLKNVGGFQSMGNEWAGQIKSGPYPNAGAHALSRIQRMNGRG